MILYAEHISKSYRQFDGMRCSVLKNFTAAFYPSKIYGIWGASGCGKSTLLSLLAGCDTPDQGSILIKDNNRSYMPTECRENHTLSYITQHTVLIPELSIYENLQIKLLLSCSQDNHEQIINFWADKFNILGLLSSYPSMLSGGQKQRIAQTQGYLTKPKFILIDEPTAHLDACNTTYWIEASQFLVREYNSCIIVASHDPAIIDICDKVINFDFVEACYYSG